MKNPGLVVYLEENQKVLEFMVIVLAEVFQLEMMVTVQDLELILMMWVSLVFLGLKNYGHRK
jgi:uncharacterized protein YqgQ